MKLLLALILCFSTKSQGAFFLETSGLSFKYLFILQFYITFTLNIYVSIEFITMPYKEDQFTIALYLIYNIYNNIHDSKCNFSQQYEDINDREECHVFLMVLNL